MVRIFRKGGTVSLVVLIAIFAILLPAKIFAPLDSLLQTISANIGNQQYRGDGVMVLVDYDKTSDIGIQDIDVLPRLLGIIATARPKRILIDDKASGPKNEREAAALQSALVKLPEKPALVVAATPKNDFTFSEVYSLREPRARFNVAEPLPEIAQNVILVNNAGDLGYFGAPIDIAGPIESPFGTIPSAAQYLADYNSDFPPALPTNQRYDTASIPKYRAVDLISGKQDVLKLANKSVVISRKGYDGVRTARDLSIEQAVITILGAQSLIDGPPVLLGSLPGFIFAILAAVAWTFLPRPAGRIVGLTSIAVLLFGPVFLEGKLIYARVSDGLLLLLALGAMRLRSRYRQALADAQNAAASKSWFLAQASHDLRQPIHAIGMLSARLGQTEMAPIQRDLVRKIDRSIDGASRMFKSLLDVASLESGSLSPVMVAVSINEILAEVEETQGVLAERAGVELRLVPSDLVIFTDRALAATLLQNLVSNSLKYATGKKVLVGARRRGGTVALCVYDRGAGIDPKNIRKISKEFFRISSKGPIDGSGLGLAIVERLCALMNLRFEIKSNPGRGTGVVIDGFPITEDALETTPPKTSVESPYLNGLKVVLIDDDLDSLRATDALITQWGCQTMCETTFPDAPDCDLIVSDFDFGDGTSLVDHIDRIRSLRENGIKTIVVSGHATSFVKDAMAGTVSTVLAKPLRPAELRSTMMAVRMSSDR